MKNKDEGANNSSTQEKIGQKEKNNKVEEIVVDTGAGEVEEGVGEEREEEEQQTHEVEIIEEKQQTQEEETAEEKEEQRRQEEEARKEEQRRQEEEARKEEQRHQEEEAHQEKKQLTVKLTIKEQLIDWEKYSEDEEEEKKEDDNELTVEDVQKNAEEVINNLNSAWFGFLNGKWRKAKTMEESLQAAKTELTTRTTTPMTAKEFLNHTRSGSGSFSNRKPISLKQAAETRRHWLWDTMTFKKNPPASAKEIQKTGTATSLRTPSLRSSSGSSSD